MKTIPRNETQTRLDEIFEDAQAGLPVLLVRNGQVVKLERVKPPEFGGDIPTLEKMLLDGVRSQHQDWTPQDLEDIACRVREQRGK